MISVFVGIVVFPPDRNENEHEHAAHHEHKAEHDKAAKHTPVVIKNAEGQPAKGPKHEYETDDEPHDHSDFSNAVTRASMAPTKKHAQKISTISDPPLCMGLHQ
jgi:hypothetical protein